MRKTSRAILLLLAIVLSYAHSFGQAPCIDTSFRYRYQSNTSFELREHNSSNDGSTILAGNIQDSQQNQDALVLKISPAGQMIWAQRLANTGAAMIAQKAVVLSDGNFVISGPFKTNGPSFPKCFLAKLSASGAFIWSSLLSMDSLDARFSQADILDLYALSEGDAGSILITLRNSHSDANPALDSTHAIAAKIDALGNLLWSRAFALEGAAYPNLTNNPAGIYEVNGKVHVVGQIADQGTTSCNWSNGAIVGTQFFGMQLDGTTGNWELTKSYCYQDAQPIQNYTFYKNHFATTLLQNGRIALYGRMIGMSAQYAYAYQVQFNDNMDLVKSAAYQTPRFGSVFSQIYVQPNEQVNLYLTGYANRQYWAKLDANGNALRQRKLTYPNNAAGHNSFAYRAPNYTTYITNFQNYAEFNQLQDGDPGLDSCLGVDTSFAVSIPFPTAASNFNWRSQINNPLKQAALNITTAEESFQQQQVCGEISRCDSVHIIGPDTLCSSGLVSFQALRNPDCHKRIVWEIDPAAITQPLALLNDTTVAVSFTAPGSATRWKLKAHAQGCGVAIDSMEVTILPAPKALPADSLICTATQIRLTPGPDQSQYAWQNGSSDSVFVATQPGLYWVEVTTGCGISFRDSILIQRASMNITGNDTLCVGDTAALHASPGFTVYHWGSFAAYMLSDDTTALAMPQSSSQYWVSGTTSAGCVVSDTLTIYVHSKTELQLRSDTSICEGDTLTLVAGPDFMSYQWNTGSNLTSIPASSPGLYELMATDQHGCVSRDSFRLISLLPKPMLNIHQHTSLCIHQNDTLSAGLGFSNYAWNDGSHQNNLPVSAPGSYWVEVANAAGCTSRDSVQIIALYPGPKDFLPADTSICAGHILSLQPNGQFQAYQWGNGSVNSAIVVTVPGSYTLSVLDVNGCYGTDSIQIALAVCAQTVFFPSVFTPNGDGRNDSFGGIVSGGLVSYNLKIYNRWGQLVFQTTNPATKWDGTLQGGQQPVGSFVWFCSYQFSGGSLTLDKGVLTLIR